METVVVIESDPANLLALAMILRCFGYRVLEARTVGEAWVACINHGEAINLIIAKAFLNNDSTSRFVAGLQILYPQIRGAIFLSDEAAGQIPDMTCEYAILQRPISLDSLAHTIRRLLDGAERRASAPGW